MKSDLPSKHRPKLFDQYYSNEHSTLDKNMLKDYFFNI